MSRPLGYWVPFDQTVPLPLLPPPTVGYESICFPTELRAYVLGALSTLVRPEIYDATQEESKVVRAYFETLLGNVDEGCQGISGHYPNWYAVTTPRLNGGCQVATLSLYEVSRSLNPSRKVYVGNLDLGICDVCHFDLHFGAISDNSPVGGKVVEVNFMRSYATLGSFIATTVTDCFGQIQVVNQFTLPDNHAYSYITPWKNIEVTVNTDMFISITIEDDWVCGVA